MKTIENTICEVNTEKSETQLQLKRRLVNACRNQMEMKICCLDDLIDENHPARRIWGYLEQLNLTKALQNIKSIEGGVGRPAIDPKILIALWIYATILGIGSAWTLSEYCQDHNGFKWICGGVKIDRKTLSNFRSTNGEAFEEVLINGVALLSKANLVTLEEISQDGMRVRACASKHSFHRKKTLNEHLKEAKERVDYLKKELEADPAGCRNRVKSTQKAKAQEQLNRLEQAKKELEKYQKEKNSNRVKNRKKKLTKEERFELRVSTTDPEARNMKMPNGGFRPAYNVQFAVDTASQVIVGVNTSNSNDAGEMLPMFKKIVNTFGKTPSNYLVDSGFKNQKAMKILHEKGCKIYMPSENSKDATKKKVYPNNNEEFILDWKNRMQSQEGKEIYKKRASTVECVNATARNRGFYKVLIRGLEKVKGVVALIAIAHNMTRTMTYGCA